MRIATFNCNSVRQRLDIVLEWLAENQPDALALQETKVVDDQFPIAPFEDNGWHVEIYGQKSYNGVALVTKTPPQDVVRGMGLHQPGMVEDDKRVIAATLGGVRIVNTYVPNGSRVGSDKWAYKMAWLERFKVYAAEELTRHQRLVWLGDVNIARRPDDVFDSPKHLGGVGHHPDEFARLDAILELGLEDVFRRFHQGPGHHTFWEFVMPRALERNLGWRIDTLYATAALATSARRCDIDVEPRRREKPSDHTFVVADFDV